MEVQLPASTKAHTQEAVADVKKSGFFSVLSTWKMGDSCLKAHLPEKIKSSCFRAHLHISVEAEDFKERERETEQKDQETGCKVLYMQREHSPLQ